MSKRGNGEGSVCRRPDGRWQGSITIGRDDRGRLIRKYFYGKTRKETSEKLNRAIEELRDNRFINKSDNPTVEQWCHEWLWSYKRNSVKQKTFDQYETILRTHIIPDIGDIRLADLKTMHIQRIINKMHDSGLSHRTIEVMKIVMHAALKQAQRNKLVSENVCENVVLPRKQPKHIRVLNEDEQTKLIAALKDNYIGRGLLFALYTGMRRGEVLALKWSDYDKNEKTISITKALSRVRTYNKDGNKTMLTVTTPKTDTSIRTVPLIDKAVELLAEHKRKQERYMELVGDYYTDNDLIFSSSRGDYLDPGNFNRKLNKTVKKIGIAQISPHALRHSFATRGLEAEVSLKAMQELLGHSSITVTGDIYTHILKEQKRKEISKLNDVFK
ncbi:MAG: tyrosine-type recombinase/integrase [Eubacteriales bacterium]|nr:tyrosine-type recombinase/integrase [Eubacteriales bacterium]